MRRILCIAVLFAFIAVAAHAEVTPLPPTHRVLVPLFGWEQGTWGGQFTAWLQALRSGGYTVEVVPQVPDLTGQQLLEHYDVVAMTTRSIYAGVLTPQFQVALETFLRQGGGVILVQTADQYAWMDQPVSLLLPTSFYRIGPGWGTALAGHDVHILPGREHPLTKGIDWTTAPSINTICPTPAPTNEIYRGALQLLAPREELRKPLLNGEWAEILTADDVEHTPLATAGTYGRGHVLVWGIGFGGDPNKADVPTPFTQWAGFTPMWRQFLAWTAGDKVKSARDSVWICGAARDTLPGKAWSGQGWAFPAAVSYALPEFGFSRTESPNDAQAALVLKADAAQDATLKRFAEDGVWQMICDPLALDGALKEYSPCLQEEAATPALPTLTLGAAVPKLSAPPVKPALPQPARITDPTVQPPLHWKVMATNSVTFQRDLTEGWQAPGYDDTAWETRALGPLSQTLGGTTVPLTGAIWYSAHITVPATIPVGATWTFDLRIGLFRPQLRAWVDGKEAALDGWSLRLERLAPGEHLLALRLYNAGGGSYWQGSRELYNNSGIAGVVAEIRPKTTTVDDWGTRWGYRTPTDVTSGASSKLPADAPVLFRGRADGDHDFRLTVTLTPEQSKQSPLLLFDEPGLIRQVTVNGTRVARIEQGAWDGVSGGNCSVFLLRNVLHDGENVIEFHPDFLRLRDEDYPVASEVSAPCGLPRLEFTGDLQALVAVDPQYAIYIPNRLYKPGKVRAANPIGRVLLRWNDGRPALVRRGTLLAWTSDITAQLNAVPVHQWQVTWESSGHWDFNAADDLPRGDALLWENTAPLLAAMLAERKDHREPRIAAVQRHGFAPAIDIVIDNPGAAQSGVLLARVLDWQGSLTMDRRVPVQLPPGRSTINLPVTTALHEGYGVRDTYAFYLGLRSEDLTVGWCCVEKVLDLPPPVRVTVETDSLNARVARGDIPDRLADNPSFRGRHLWWPLLNEDPGSLVYLDGEILQARVTVTNETDAPRDVTVNTSLIAQSRKEVTQHVLQTMRLAPYSRVRLKDFAKPLTGVFEPYQLLVTVEEKDQPREEVSRPLYAVRPWKRSNNVDTAPRDDGISFNCYSPFSYLQQPDNIISTERYVINRDPHNPGPFPELLEWWKSTGTGTVGHGGGVNGYNGLTQGFGWGPFYRPTFNAPDQMSVLPNGQPVMHYIADGLRREVKTPGRYEVADFWGNYWVPVNWNTLTAFREWLAVNAPQQAATFTPQTFDDAVTIIRNNLGPEWNHWQSVVAIGGWDAIRRTAASGSAFWCQAENAWIACQGVWNAPLGQPADGRAVAKFLSDMYVAGDTDPATSRMGWGYRFRSYTENTAVALAPNMHCNVTTLRHVYFLNEQRMDNMGNATPETYRAHVYDTLWAAAVNPDGSLRAVVDTPPSEITNMPNPTWSGLKFGNRLYNQMYRLASVIEPQRAFGLLWVAAVPRGKSGIDPRGIYETLRNNGVPFSAMIGPDLLAVAPKTGANGLIYLLPPELMAEELDGLRKLAAAKFPVVCLLPPDLATVKAQLPVGITVVELPKSYTPELARRLAVQINTISGVMIQETEGTCISGFRAQNRVFLVVQNMWPTPRRLTITLAAKTFGLSRAITAVDLNTNTAIPTHTTTDQVTITVPVGPWDASLIECVSNAR